jgi:hypothetical protein
MPQSPTHGPGPGPGLGPGLPPQDPHTHTLRRLGSPVLRAHVASLPVELRGVVALEKQVQQRIEGDLLWVIQHLYHLGVTRLAAAHLRGACGGAAARGGGGSGHGHQHGRDAGDRLRS